MVKAGRQIKRLCIADVSFRQAGLLAQALIANGVDATNMTYTPMVAGMVITYAKNFVEGNEFGTLRSPFTDFQDQAMFEAHHTAMIVRHKVYAHRDVAAAREFQHDDTDPAETYEVRIRLHEDGIGCDATVILPDVPTAFLPTFAALCDLQHQRAKTEIRSLVTTVARRGHYSPGDYIVGIDFPNLSRGQ